LNKNIFICISGLRQPRFVLAGDCSVKTFLGHSVLFTLIRCYFSPQHTTGQRYIISGSADGCIYIYDILTGHTEYCLQINDRNRNRADENVVRDVSWHPYENYIISTSVGFFVVVINKK